MLFSHPPVSMSERDMMTDKDPYLAERNRAGQGGANALLVRSRMLVSRHDLNCAAAQPITDCPLSEGAWFSVVFEDYACSPAAVATLEKTAPTP